MCYATSTDGLVCTSDPEENDEQVVTDALDLLRSIVQSNPSQAEGLMASLESQDKATDVAQPPPDLVQLTTMILEEALWMAVSSRDT